MPGHPIAVGWSVVLVVAIMIAVGAMQGRMITKLGLQPFIVTLGGMMALRGVAHVLTRGGTAGLGPGHESFRALASGTVLGVVPMPVVVLAIAAALVHALLHHTVLGSRSTPSARNEEAARYSGIDVSRAKRIAYTLCAALAAAAGVLYAAYLRRCSQRSAPLSSSTPSPPRCWAAARCAAAKGRCSASSPARR